MAATTMHYNLGSRDPHGAAGTGTRGFLGGQTSSSYNSSSSSSNNNNSINALHQVSSTGSGSPRSLHSNPSIISSLGNGAPNPTEDELAGRTYLEWLKSWDDGQVAQWLADSRCGAHAQTFANNDIRGNVLLDVDQQALKEMGVQSVGDRVKITVAIKKLRQACITASATAAFASRRPLAQSLSNSSVGSNSRSASNGGKASAPTSPTYVTSPGAAVVAQAQIARRVSNGKTAHRIPPPLHLASSSVTDARLPQAYQSASSGSPSAPSTANALSNNIATYGARSSSNAANAALLAAAGASGGTANNHAGRGAATSPRSGSQALPPPPKGQLPHPPGSRQNVTTASASRLNQLAAPAISTTAASPTTLQPDLNSLRRPRPTQTGIEQYSHRKAGSSGGGSISSLSGVASSHPYAASHPPRPSTSTANYPAHQQHPFAAAGSSPTRDDFMSSSGSASSLNSIGGSSYRSNASSTGLAAQSGKSFGLSPITETSSTSSSGVTPVSPENGHQYGSYPSSSNSSSSLKAQQAYGSGNKAGYGRAGTASGQVIPLEDVMRKTVKFIGDDGISKMVNVDGAKDAYEVMLRALRKFGKLGSNALPSNTSSNKSKDEYGDTYAEMDGHGVYANLSDGSTKALTELELLNICQSATRPERARGLVLRRLHLSPASPEQARAAKSKKLRNFFGEDLGKSVLSPTSPTNMLDVTLPATSVEPNSPTPSSPSMDDDATPFSLAPTPPQKPRQQARNTMNRASAVSIMSGLNWGGNNGAPANRSPSGGFITSHHQKLKNFFGQRPPSELISTHLVDYFPTAPNEKKILSKSVRQNVRKSMMRRESAYGLPTGKTSWDASRDSQSLHGLGVSRFSVSSMGSSHRSSIDTVPPLPTKDHNFARRSEEHDADQSRPSMQRHVSSSSVPPSINVDSDDEDDSQSVTSSATRKTKKDRSSSRLSVWSQSKSNRDSDSTSLLTVEEITEDLEKRRMSQASWPPEQASELASIGDAGGNGESGHAAGSSSLDISGDSLSASDLSAEDAIIEEDDESSEDDDDDEIEQDEEEEEEEDEDDDAPADVPQTVTTTTKKSTFRWVKGALIGSGSFGQVYLGMNASNGSFMAVKQVELPTGNSHNEERKKAMLSALEREIELLKEIQHSNIVQYLDSSSDGKHLHIFLEYVPGGSVAHLLANYGAFEEPLVRTFVKQILQGLSYLHEHDIIHRDIKGANILVDNRGGIKISDFGISKKVEEIFWMAPEVVKQTSYTAKADVWSLGCLIVEMFTGHHPWMELTQMQAIFKIGSAKDARPANPPDISPEAAAFLDLAFKMDYNERPTASELSKHDFITQEWTPSTPTS